MAKNNIVALVGLGALALWALAKKKAPVEGTYSCPVCGLVFPTAEALAAHIASHHPELVGPDPELGYGYPCSLCDYIAATPEELTIHIATAHPQVIGVIPPEPIEPPGTWSYTNHLGQNTLWIVGAGTMEQLYISCDIKNIGSQTETRAITLYMKMVSTEVSSSLTSASLTLDPQESHSFQWNGTPADAGRATFWIQDSEGDGTDSISVNV